MTASLPIAPPSRSVGPLGDAERLARLAANEAAHINRRHPEARPPYPQPKAPPGSPRRCRWCWRDIKEKRRTSWCSAACVLEYRLLNDWAFIRLEVDKRDRGVCALCGADTLWLEAVASELGRGRGRFEKIAVWEAITQAPAFRVAREFDHILPRACGGCDHPDNIRTLCIPCHRAVTARQRAEWAESARRAREASVRRLAEVGG